LAYVGLHFEIEMELQGWKEIAAYLGVTERTAQNRANDRRMPVHHLPGQKGRVFAETKELDAWKKFTEGEAWKLPPFEQHKPIELRISEMEAVILYAISHCAGNAYGVSISDTIQERTSDEVALGTIYATLDRLETTGLVRSQWSQPNSERSGRRKRLFEITGGGRAALVAYDTRLMRIRAGWCLSPKEAR